VLLLAGAVVAWLLVGHARDQTPRTHAVVTSRVAALGAGAPGTGSGGRGVSASGRASGSDGSVSGRGSGGDPPVTVSVGDRTVGQPIAPGFLGFSFEFQAVRTYTGTDPEQINPVLVQLIRNLTPGQAPVLRIGGDSTDVSYAPAPGVKRPAYVTYTLTPSWMASTAALAKDLGARMILGLNLAANEPSLAAAEARDYIKAFGAGAIDALEIGNEPNVYAKITVYHTVFGVPVPARPKDFAYPAFRGQFQAIAAAAPQLPLAGPALAIGPTPGPGSWVHVMAGFLRSQPRVRTMTVHRYPLRNCYVPPSSPQYPTISHLLSSYATVGLAASLTRWVGMAHRAGRALRVDELNSVACRGKAGVSDTFASALWATDALFSLARAGVDGIDVHTLPNAAYELFQFSHTGGRWRGTVRPVYYGLQLFAQAAPAGSQLLQVARHGSDSGLSAWATRAPDHAIRVVLINKNQTHTRTVRVTVPGGSATATTVERMAAPSVASRGGVTLGGQTYGAETGSGRLPAPRVTTVTAAGGEVTVSVPHGSAALVTFGAAPPAG
jgi:hypothetical protein